MGSEETPLSDMFLQEHLLHSYSLLSKEKKGFIESKEGYTYVSNQVQEKVSSRLLNFASKKNSVAFESRIHANVKRIKDKGTDDYDSVYIDMDYLLAEYVEIYRQERKDRHKNLR